MGVVNKRNRRFALGDGDEMYEDDFDLGDFFYVQQDAYLSHSDYESESESEEPLDDEDAIWASWKQKLDVIRDRCLDLEEMRTWCKENHHEESEGKYILLLRRKCKLHFK